MRNSRALVLTVLIAALSGAPGGAALTHRYSFNETVGSSAGDSVGAAAGSLENGTFFNGAGQVEFDGTDDFIALPANLISSLGSVTIETWILDYGSPDWTRVFDFGRQNGTVGEAWLYIAYPPPAVTGGIPSIRGEVNPIAPSIVNAPRPSTGVPHHVALVIDAARSNAFIYVDGVVAAVNRGGFPGNPSTVGAMPNVWIGRSQFSADPNFFGQMDEFRIWGQALGAAAVAASYQAGADTVSTNSGTLTNITLTVASPMISGGVQNPVLTGGYENLTATVDISAEPGVVYASDDTNVIMVANGITLLAVGTGTATVTASFEGRTDSKSISVIAQPAAIAHRYSFNESGGTVINDSEGTAHGTVVSGTLGGGRLELNSTLGDHAMLPQGIVSVLTNATFQFWARWDNNAAATRYFDFGNNNGSTGIEWFQLSPNANSVPNRQARLVINDGTGAAANAAVATPTNQMVCVTAVFNDSANFEKLYFDGVLVAQNLAMTKSLSSISDFFNYIGKSQFAADPTFAGAFDEFRIFDGAMNDFEVTVSSAAGPNDVVVNPGTLLAIRIVAASTNLDAHGASTPFSVYADYSAVTNVNITSQPGLALSSSASDVVVPTAAGQLQPAGAGVATVSATFQSLTGNLAVSVTDTSAWPKLLHRYSFNEGAGATVNDSIGTAHGNVIGTASWSAGRLVLPGGPSVGFVPGNNPSAGYVDLPNNLIASLPAETSFEFWVQWNGGGIWQRVFDFGTSTGGEDAQGTGLTYLMLTPSGGGGVARAEYFYDSQSRLVLGAPAQFPPNTLTHVVVTHDAARQTARLYINGTRVSTGTVTNLLSDIPQANIWLGRAQWTDPYFAGEYEEFRIWSGALTDAQVNASRAAGPNVVTGPGLSIAPAGGNVALRWPANAGNFTLQTTTNLAPASWSPVGGTPAVVNGLNVLTVAPSNNATFYRLTP